MIFDKLVKIKNFDGDIRMKIVSYVEMKADQFKAEVGNSQLTIVDNEHYEYIEEFKKNNPNVVRCIPLDEINYFSLTMKPTERELKIFEDNDFVLKGTDAYGNDFYVRKELLN